VTKAFKVGLVYAAGTATVAPIKFTSTSATLLTTPTAGSMEVDSSGNLYYSPSTTRYTVPLSTTGNSLIFTTSGATTITLPTSGTMITSSSPTITTPTIDVINAASATGTTATLFTNISTGSINIGGSALTTGTINIGVAGTGINPIVIGKSTSTITLGALPTAGFVKTSATGLLSVDTNTYLTTTAAGTTYSPIAGSASITTVGTVTAGSIPAANLSGTTLASGITSSSLTSVGTLSTVSMTGGTTGSSALTISTNNTYGGAGYAGFLTATNTTIGATNANKFFRINSIGGFEIINSAYTTVLFTLTDAGLVSSYGGFSGSGASLTSLTAANIAAGTLGSTVLPAAGTVTTAGQIGYMGLPQNLNPGAYTITAADNGKHLYYTTTGQTVTIPAAATLALPIGFTFVVINAAAVTTSIAITTDTMYLAGTGATGTRTLAAYGMATVVKVAGPTSAGVWMISGNGLT